MADKTIEDIRPNRSKLWFEYHCWEDPRSSDAEIWYRSHQQIEILSRNDNGITEDNCEDVATFAERAYAGEQFTYKARWDDGFEGDIFEDELLNSPNQYARPNPPKKEEAINV